MEDRVCLFCGGTYSYDIGGIGDNSNYRMGSYCSRECDMGHRLAKRRQTNLERYGVDHYNKGAEARERLSISNSGGRGSSSREALERRIQTNLERYGVDNPSKSDAVKGRIREVFIENYGVDNPMKVGEIKDKARNTNLEKYGAEIWSGNRELMEKANAKRIRTNLERYGVVDISQAHIDNVDEFNADDIVRLFTDGEGYIDIDGASEYFGVFRNSVHRVLRKAGADVRYRKSQMQIEVFDYIKEIYDGEVIQDSRSVIEPLEIDIFIPDKKLAIEFNGLYWHSFGLGDEIDKGYHLRKTELCADNGISLLHIREDEWVSKGDIWKSMIASRLGVADRVYARKCIVVELSYLQGKSFMESNHIQGSVPASVVLGLEHGGEVVAMMTFGKCRYGKKHEWELLRFCNKVGSIVVGGFSKLLGYFVKGYNPKSIVSYANRRWSIGNVYEECGFVREGISDPGYVYVKRDSVFSRIQFQKHKLVNKLDDFDESKTEIENMLRNGYRIMFDCGNFVYGKFYILD